MRAFRPIKPEAVQMMGVDRYPKIKRPYHYSMSCEPLFDEPRMVLSDGQYLYNVWPNKRLFDDRNFIYDFLLGYQEKGFTILYDEDFEWTGEGLGQLNGNSRLGLGIVYAELFEQKILMFNYVVNQSGEHINLGSLAFV